MDRASMHDVQKKRTALETTERFLRRLLAVRPSASLIVLVPVLIGLVRVAIESLWMRLADSFNLLLFYALTQLLMVGALSLATGRKAAELFGIVSMGLVLAWLPPLFDLVMPADTPRHFTYFFELHWDLFASYQSVGESLTLWVVIPATGVMAGWISKSVVRGLAGAALTYGVIQFMGYGWMIACKEAATALDPAEAAPFALGPLGLALMNLSGIVILFLGHALWRRKTLGPSLLRVNHGLPQTLVCAIAARLGGNGWFDVGLKSVVFLLAFQLVIITNDYYDREQDAGASGKARPVEHDDLVLATYVMILLCLWTVFHAPLGFTYLALFFVLTAVYHQPPLRLKRFFCAGYKIEGFCAACAVLYGAQGAARADWLLVTALLALGGFSLASMFKDYKDIEQDRAARVGTIYTECLKRGLSLGAIHGTVRVVTTLMLLIPPSWLLARGEPLLPVLGLFALALVPGWLLGLTHKTRAVEATLLGVAAYLFYLMLLVPTVATPGPGLIVTPLP